MPRPPREIVPGGIYHITTRGNNRQDIFLDKEDRQTYLSFLKIVKEMFQFKLYLYVLMTNHVHLLIETSLDEVKSIPHIMKSLTLRYTKYFNKKYSRSGNLFQPKYFSVLLQKDAHLLILTRYIHLNPLRANIVRDLKEYPYSSYLSYIDCKSDELLDHKDILSLFGKKDSTQRRKYRQFVEDGIALWKLCVPRKFNKNQFSKMW